MNNQQDAYQTLVQQIEDLYDSRDSPAFRSAVDALRQFANDGSIEAATFLGELLALPGALYSPSDAYKWYYIGLSQSGYSTDFQDENHTPPHYRGPVGDFRNESMVSELVLTLGFDEIPSLDDEASAWLKSRGTET